MSALAIWAINTRRAPSSCAHKSSTCLEDRLRIRAALGPGDDSHRNRSVVIHELLHHGRGVELVDTDRPGGRAGSIGETHVSCV